MNVGFQVTFYLQIYIFNKIVSSKKSLTHIAEYVKNKKPKTKRRKKLIKICVNEDYVICPNQIVVKTKSDPIKSYIKCCNSTNALNSRLKY